MNSQTSRNISTIVGALNIVPSFMLSRKLVQSAGWKGSMLPGPNIAVMRQNKALTAVYLGLMAAQVGFALKGLYDQYREDSQTDEPTGRFADTVAFDDLPDDVKERIGRKLHDLVTTLDEAADAGDLSTWLDDDVSRCEADHVLGGPCFTPLNEDGTCPHTDDHAQSVTVTDIKDSSQS